MSQSDINEFFYADALYFIDKHREIQKNDMENEKSKILWHAYIQCNPRSVISHFKGGKDNPEKTELSKLQALKSQMEHLKNGIYRE